MSKSVLIISTLLIFSINTLFAQDSISQNEYKNIIRWNITPMMVVGPKSFVIGYERVIKPFQSFSINIGYMEKSALENDDGEKIEIFDQNSKGGIDISADYRFYFKSENKYHAPHGLYWGPFASYYKIWQDAGLNLMDNGSIKNTINYQGSLSMYNLGLQIGYQFVIKNRFTIDLIAMGPSYTYYDINMKLHYEQTIDPQDPFYNDLYNLIKDSSPVLGHLLTDNKIDASGRLKLHYWGFRYGVQLGYRF